MFNILYYEDDLISSMLQKRKSGSSNLQIFVKSEKNISINVNQSDKIFDVKSSIFGMSQNEINLSFQGEILDDESTVEECEMCDRSVIDIVGKLRGGMQIFAKTMDDRTIAFEVTKYDKIIDIKRKIEFKLNVHPNEQNLVFQGRFLEDDKTVEECKIVDKSVINLGIKLRSGIHILAQTMDGRTLLLEVGQTDKISDLKIDIQENIGIVPDDQKLICEGEILEDDRTIDDYQIAEKSVIYVIVRLRGGMQIFAKTMDGKTVAFEVSKNEKISNIKKKIQEKIGLNPEEQTLVFQGGILEDNKTVEEYQIAEKAVINVVARLRGNGMQIFAKTMDGRSVAIEVLKSCKISDLKIKIQEKTGLHPDEHNLFFHDQLLEDDKTV